MGNRRGLTLAELIITIFILGLIAMLGFPALNSIGAVKEKSTIKELGHTYLWLIEEASVRNVVFRVKFNLDQRTWKVEVADPNMMIFSSPKEAEEFKEEVEDDRSKLPTAFQQPANGEEDEDEEVTDLRDAGKRFEGLESEYFSTEQKLPAGLSFDFVYTPQYGEEARRPNPEPPEDAKDEIIAYSHIFPDNTAEHTVIRIISDDHPEEGYTLEIEPMTGTMNITDEIISPTDSMSWLPEEGPTIQ